VNLQFDPAEHVYSADGIVIPGVTSVLEAVGIIDYARIPEGTRVMALERGRHVHTLCQFDDEGSLDPDTVDVRLAGYLEAWRRFREDFRFHPELIEHRGFSAIHRYAGTLDRRGIIGYGTDKAYQTLLDIKTSVAPYWTKFQTAAYANFFESPAKYRRMAVALRQDGTYKVSEYRCADFSAHFNVFLAALTVVQSKG
jgi:hypothetical protein